MFFFLALILTVLNLGLTMGDPDFVPASPQEAEKSIQNNSSLPNHKNQQQKEEETEKDSFAKKRSRYERDHSQKIKRRAPKG